MKSQLFIHSNSVTLRPFKLEDQAAVYALTQQPEITDVLPDWKMTEEQLREFLQFVVGSYEQFNPEDIRILLAVVHNKDQRIIGWCGVFPNDLLDRADREVAYAISRDYRNKGYITEAVRALTAYLFEHTLLDRGHCEALQSAVTQSSGACGFSLYLSQNAYGQGVLRLF